MSGASVLLDMRGLVVRAGAQTLVNGVSLALGRGQVLGLIGESGAGKSTIGLAALGFVRPGCRISAGEVLLDGENLLALDAASLRARRRQRVAYVAQSAASAFNPAWRIAAQVTEAPRIDRRFSASAADDNAAGLFARLELPDPQHFGRRYPHQVSGGQLQRAMLAMALAGEPDLVVFDEPTTALDVVTQLEVLRVVRDVIAARGLAALYISHDIAVVAQVADRIAVLRDGELVEEGATRQIIDHPHAAYTRELVALHTGSHAARRPAAADTLLSARGIEAGYGRHPAAVTGVDLAIARGEVLGIVGESGSGKSTLARVLTGLLPPRAGELRFDGQPLAGRVQRRSREQCRRMQLVHQMPDVALNPRQPVSLIIGRPLQLYRGLHGRARDAAVATLLAEIGLDPSLSTRLPGALSGGQKQRVCIARALAAEPDLLVCDEITSALDPLVQDGIITLLERLQRERALAIAFITHDISLARRFAHRVLVMSEGRVVESGTATEVLDAPRHPYTRTLLAAVPTVEAGWMERALQLPSGRAMS